LNDREIKLMGGPEKTATWIWLDPETGGQLKVEFYDFSELAQRMFGNDIAYILTVIEMTKLYSFAKQAETSLLPWLAANFKSYLDLKQWLEENGIEFHKEVDPWA
jgi:hypothetical protein